MHRNIEHEGEMYTSLDPVLSGGPYRLGYPNSRDELIQVTKCVPEGQYTFTIYVSDLLCVFAAMYVYVYTLFNL